MLYTICLIRCSMLPWYLVAGTCWCNRVDSWRPRQMLRPLTTYTAPACSGSNSSGIHLTNGLIQTQTWSNPPDQPPFIAATSLTECDPWPLHHACAFQLALSGSCCCGSVCVCACVCIRYLQQLAMKQEIFCCRCACKWQQPCPKWTPNCLVLSACIALCI